MPHQSNTEMLDGLSDSHVVELSVLAPHGQDQVQEDMKNFAEQLKPYPFRSEVISTFNFLYISM